MELFDGYLPVHGKQPAIKEWGRPTELYSLEQAQKFNEYGGRIAENIVLIDVDNREQADCLLKIVEQENISTIVYKTDRGLHFYFENDGTFLKCESHKKLAIGLEADIKVGTSNSYAKLKSNGVERKIIRNTEKLQTIPKWLRPLNAQKLQAELFNLSEGDGRNDTLYRYIIPLINSGFTKEESRECIRLINKYVFAQSLENKELETILRDEAFENLHPDFYGNNKKLQIDELSKFIINKLHIKRINEKLYAYQNGFYVLASKLRGNYVLQYVKNPRKNIRNEVEAFINDFIIENATVADPRYIGFKNGIYDLEERKLISFDPNIVITNPINHNYISDAYDADTDKFLSNITCGDKALRANLEELLGYCLYRENSLQKFFLLYGSGSNGKSMFCTFIRAVLGEENCSSESLQRLGERFGSSSIYNKLANICDDNSSMHIKDPAMLKILSSGGNYQTEFKGKDSFSYTPFCKLIFCMNKLPKINDNGQAVQRRLVIIPFNRSIPENEQDTALKKKLTKDSAIEYGIRIAIEGLNRLLENNKFTESEKIDQQLNNYLGYNNPIADFVKKKGGIEYLLSNYCGDIYSEYQRYCEENCSEKISIQMFGKQICSMYDLKSHSVNPNDGTTDRHKKYRRR
ncbi:DNA primase family protein [Succinatimonas hippei]|uniref:Phage/plasmid primase, P4 family domain protein n=1 Tax=Succinatimonas hippei (strain DSM 22608 / JCM 16073 / KCTC 15190 / YIT 12066) TaxID=762983 RepID=E8LL94_SUCHY|nr:phage/plasmid primase, P4 family [Succinatimonas hippei]EFY06709.1 phage/plasmid primase, P4 family domain protein [Succinatimonas hippei YIT 12066]